MSDSSRMYRFTPEDKARIRAFKNTFFEHNRLGDLRAAVLDALDDTHPAEVIAVCGPTGVGKTTLSESVARGVPEIYDDLVPNDIPVVSMTCDESKGRGYDFNRGHFETILSATGDPFLDSHFDPDVAAARRRSGNHGHVSDRLARGSDLRRAAVQQIELNRTRVLLIDEAQHMTGGPRSTRAAHNMDVIKKFGIDTRVKQVLFGTEHLFDLLRANAQLTRRTEELFFDAYDNQVKADVHAFAQAYQSLAMSLPCDDPALFESKLEDVFFHTAGCVGVLKDTMVKSLRVALRHGRQAVSYSDLKSQFLSKARHPKLLKGIANFRTSVLGESGLDEYRILWRIDSRFIPTPSKKSNVPGIRKPHRDLVLPSGSQSTPDPAP